MLMTNKFQQGFIVAVSLLAAFYIQELPSSNVLQLVLPEWPFLIVLYFSVSSHFFFGIVVAFGVGLIEDVFLGMPVLGLHAGIYAISAFVMLALQNRFEHINLVTQTLIIGVMVLFKLIVITLFASIWYSPSLHFWAFLSIPISMLMWPLLNLMFAFFPSRYQ
ncbi:MAG: rod shape-determining protein MreD [Gammaproteobacteria bacterium]|nr:MAG: rod shape-determining protein MreD [Gammaproteobacteria bacterium]